jgi:hypothetical protein
MHFNIAVQIGGCRERWPTAQDRQARGKSGQGSRSGRGQVVSLQIGNQGSDARAQLGANGLVEVRWLATPFDAVNAGQSEGVAPLKRWALFRRSSQYP